MMSGGLHAVRIDMIGADQLADDAHALFDEVDGGAVKVEAVAAALIALEDEAAILAQQQAGLVDQRVIQRVASIARAA